MRISQGITGNKVGLALAFLGVFLAFVGLGAPAVGILITPAEGWVLIILAVPCFIGIPVALFWPDSSVRNARKRAALNTLLGRAHEQGEDLYVYYDEDDVVEWANRTHELIKKSLGESHARRFFSDRGIGPTSLKEAESAHRFMQEKLLGNRLRRLEELMKELPHLDVCPDFDPQDRD